MAAYNAGMLARRFSTSALRLEMAKTPIKLWGMEGRYATALYSAATKEKKLDKVEKEISAFQNLLKTDAKLSQFLSDPSQQRQVKMQAMSEIVKSQKYDPITANFFGAVAENGRLSKTNKILNAFNKLMKAHKGEIYFTVTTATPLDAASQKELKAALAGFVQKGETLTLELKVDPEILGGMLVDMGDKFIDMSTASKITKYETVIAEAI